MSIDHREVGSNTDAYLPHSACFAERISEPLPEPPTGIVPVTGIEQRLDPELALMPSFPCASIVGVRSVDRD